MTTTIYSLFSAELAQLRKSCENCDIPCVEIRGSCQFINYVKQNMNETVGIPTTIINYGGYSAIAVDGLAVFRLVGDTSILSGYTMKIL